ncbi:MAG TPA: extracellular solute-binding protein [Fimbriimonas sp.]|nr:extracellular solute-binding protein [Fimbriimonas sp.]
MKQAWLASFAAVALMSGCTGSSSGGGSGSTGATSTATTAPKAEAPDAPTGEGKIAGAIDVSAFKGGYDIDFYQQCAKEFDAKNPGVQSTVTGDPRIWEQLQPRMVADNPPDLMFPGWDMHFWLLAEQGKIMRLEKALASPAAEGKGTWGDSFDPAILKMGQLDGKQFVLPYYINLQGWWYDPGVFVKNGWTPPKTYDELLALCEKIKAKGMAPLTFQGQYPYYMLEGMVFPWIVSIGGIQAMNDCQNLTPGAWKSPAVLQAVSMIKELNDKGYFEQGAVGLSHTESQTDFVSGKVAMIPCGTWLYSEMRKTMPPGAKMQFMLPPVVKGGKGDPSALEIGIEPWMIPSKAKNPNGGVALFKYMTSLSKAKQFVAEKGTLMAIKGSDQTQLPETLVEAAKAYRASKTLWSNQARYWYPEMQKDLEGDITGVLNGEMTPQDFCDKAEAAAEKTRNDSSISKHKV